jgi:hypothetical protein
MNKYYKIILFGLLLWLIPFAVSVMIYPLRIYQRVLFESIMPVVITIWTVFFCLIYFLGDGRGSLRDGIMLGFGWLMISNVLDLIFFMQGPMKMPFMDYLADIGVTYLIIPAITIGFGYFIEKNVGR